MITATFAICIVVLGFLPAVLAPTSIETRTIRVRPVYVDLQSEVNIAAPSTVPLVSANFTIPVADGASVYFSVGTFIQPGQCCPGSYLELISVDNGPLGAGQGLGCGGGTSTFTGTLAGVSCFGRLSFTQGIHSVHLWLQHNGNGVFTVEAGPSTALLLQFD